MPHSWPWTGAALPWVEQRASNRLRAGQLTWCHVKDSRRCSSSWRLTCHSRQPMIGSLRISLKPQPCFRSSRDRLFYGVLRRRRDRLLERRDLDFPFRLGRTYVHCCLPEPTKTPTVRGTSVIGNSRQKVQRGGDDAPAVFPARRACRPVCLTGRI